MTTLALSAPVPVCRAARIRVETSLKLVPSQLATIKLMARAMCPCGTCG